MAPANLDLSLDEVIQATKGDKGSGKGSWGGKRNAPAKEEETDMSLDELIEKDYLPPKGKGKGSSRDEDWVPKSAGSKSWDSQGGWEKTKATGGGMAAWKSWKDTGADSWGKNDWAPPAWKAAPVAWQKADPVDKWGAAGDKWGAASAKKDWSTGGKNWADDDWKPKPRGDDWSAKNSWTAPARDAGKGSWDKWNWAPKPTPWDTPRQAWRPTNEQEREERWNGAGRATDAWDRRDDRGPERWRNDGYAAAAAPRARHGAGYESHDVRDRRGRERSRTPPRRNYFDDVPRGNVIMVKNIPVGLDQRDIRDAFQSATGPVTSCKMSPDGTARISFERPEDAKKAVATFDHGELNGRIIRVNITG